ncbi:hypothetical protein INS49_005830 [Diaporthe citri]|uniref:uncharacterized protein n=1 Tax=Diaporthe citri TaxID=83186 RepID=UPI001C7FA89A|nr:uncharacterized protein INS49_005830 [Diaporthe citri]KAG6364232.1 hypothetical protein INS49_005830 [Diaporthe citri]
MWFLLMLPFFAAAVAGDEASCSALAGNSGSLGLNRTVLTNSTWIPAGAKNVSGTFNAAAFCEVSGTVSYPADNYVVFEVWLPEENAYNGRFLAVGNGGMAGTIDEPALVENLNSGYAVAGGDSGHRAAENNGGEGEAGVSISYLHDQDQILAWIHNSISYFTPPAKTIVEAYYTSAPQYSYYKGCSTGGAQGFALAQYHPELFDGIVAGCPGNWYSHLTLSFLWNAQASEGTGLEDETAGQAILDFVESAVLDHCDELDGVKDGLIENPLTCDFDLTTLACDPTAANSTQCLSASQVAAFQKIYDGPRNSTGHSLYPGFTFGSENELIQQTSGSLSNSFTASILQNVVFDDLSYDVNSFDWDADVALIDQRVGTLIDEISPDLSAFRARGGKLLVTQGWADPYNAATWPIDHKKQLEDAMGGDVSDWFSLFMLPGGGHCEGTLRHKSTPQVPHSLEKLVEWVEKGEAPQEMLFSNPPDGGNITRKACPWPSTAEYIGGDTNSWSSFVCST